MSEDQAASPGTTLGAPICWAVEIDDEMLLCPDSETEAVENWQAAEYEQGFVAVVHRGYAASSDDMALLERVRETL